MNDMTASIQASIQKSMQEFWQKEAQARAAMQAKLAAEEAALRAFQCRRCPEAFPSNSKLHQHLRDRHAKPKSDPANQLSFSPILAIDAPPDGPTVITTAFNS